MERKHVQRVVYMHELLPKDEKIPDGYEFLEFTLRGPVVLIMLDHNEFTRNSFPSPGAFWPIEENREYIGAIGIRNCSFVGCEFQSVGIAAPAKEIKRFMEPTTLE